ncbi:MAG: NADH-quinone oxidoreductase subunit NuoE [Anaerolineae bacterium]
MVYQAISKEPGSGDPAKKPMALEALYAAQEQYGYLSEEALRGVADQLGLSLKDVYSMASFYSLFRMKPTGKYVIQVCDSLSCFLRDGAERLVDYLSRRLGIDVGETTPDGRFTLERVPCLAACGTSPTLRINDELYENMTKEKIDALLKKLTKEWSGDVGENPIEERRYTQCARY